MPTLSEVLSAQNIVAYYNSIDAATAFPGEALFPSQHKLGLTISFLETQGSGIRVLKRSEFDTMAPIRDRLPVSQYQHQMPFYREQMPIKEADRQELLKVMGAGNAYFAGAIQNVYNDRVELINGARASSERMRMQALFTGGINIVDSEGLDTIYDYGFDAASQLTTLTGAAMWTTPATSTPIQDLIEGMDAAKLTGQATAYMSRKTFRDFAASASVKAAIYPNLGATGVIGNTVITDFVNTNFGMNIIVVDSLAQNYRYVDEHGVVHPFVPDNVVSIAATGVLGTTWFGTTPEEADLMSGQAKASVEIVDGGIAVTSSTSYGPPVQVTTVASMICLPTIDRIQNMHLIKTA